MDWLDMIEQAIDNGAANIVVGVLVLAGFAALLCALMFFLLTVRGIWRWLTRHSLNDVVASAGRKALK